MESFPTEDTWISLLIRCPVFSKLNKCSLTFLNHIPLKIKGFFLTPIPAALGFLTQVKHEMIKIVLCL